MHHLVQAPGQSSGRDRAGWVDRLDELHLLTPLRIVLILLVAVVLVLLVRRFVERMLRSVLDRTSSDRPRAEVRHRALASAMRGAFVGIIWTIAVITMISEVGVNIGAFVATATVVGGAVAFGAQTLIRDVIAGFFVLAEDQYGVGDDVDLGLASGSVERITLRSVRLRDGEGRVWYVPHGNVLRVANSSKASAALLDLHIDRNSDVTSALEIAGRIGRDLRDDPNCAARLTGDAEVVGVSDVRDDRIVLRVKAPTLPNEGDAVRRAWRVRALQAFRDGELVAPGASTAAAGDAPESSE